MPSPKATLVVVGGASGLTEAYLHDLESLFIEVICPFAEAQQLVVIDGGTDSGVMRLMGSTRTKTQSQFPLLGVVVKDKTFLPTATPNTEDAAPLEPNHTHFALVPGQDWGDESPWIAQMADAIAGGLPSATLLINGGAIALKQDVPNSLSSQRPVLVIAGSGRAADQLAVALQSGVSDDPLNTLITTGLIQAVALDEGAAKVREALNQVFSSLPLA
ncbi:MAG: hypothetical protein ICV62_12055 [Cyanobacteria bacterium Co-bin13]|nr:hypothetical protein [Cyanobacteria bacterium Co-bin13]